jgi:peptidoglycan hydrolase-like protein with peptidoglycan-binding domain
MEVTPVATIGYDTVKNGSSGDTVKVLQTALNRYIKSGVIKASHFPARLGNGTNVTTAMVNEILTKGLGVDGGFGNKTEAATRAFQSCKNIGVDGAIGPFGWNALFNPIIFKASSLGIYMNNGMKKLDAIVDELGSKADGIVNTMFYDMSSFLLYNPCRINGEDGENGWKFPTWGYGWNNDGILTYSLHTDRFKYKNWLGSEYLIVEGGKATTTTWADLPNTVRGRTAIGLRVDSQIVIYCGPDGTPGQCNLTQLRAFMIAAGCVTAIVLDGGGSSQVHVTGNLSVKSPENRIVRQFLYFKIATNNNAHIQTICPTCNGAGKIVT